MSSTEAEIYAASQAALEIVFMRRLLREMGVGPDERRERLLVHYRCDEFSPSPPLGRSSVVLSYVINPWRGRCWESLRRAAAATGRTTTRRRSRVHVVALPTGAKR